VNVRVLYAPRNISGQASEYARAVAPLGIDAEVWSYGETAYGFHADRVIDEQRIITDPRFRWKLLKYAIDNYDVFHFQYSRSLLETIDVTLPELWDIPFLKSLGKRVFMHFRGSDVRLRSIHTQREADSYMNDPSVPCDEDRIKTKVAICRRYCDQLLVSTPGLLDYVPDGIWVPHVVDASLKRSARTPAVPVVVHLPSSRTTKSSDVVDEVLTGLHKDGVVSYRPLRDLGHPEVMAALKEADLLVDSLAIGDHGLVSVEAMAAGVIPLCHIHERNRARNPGVPIVEARPETLEQVTRALAADPKRRAALRRECKEWVATHHDRTVVGPLLADLYHAPPTRPEGGSYEGWTLKNTKGYIKQLEAEVERLRQDGDPLLAGVGPLRRTTPSWLVARLSARIDELEAIVSDLQPGQVQHRSATRRVPQHRAAGWKDVIKSNPTLHRAARTAVKRAKKLRG